MRASLAIWLYFFVSGSVIAQGPTPEDMIARGHHERGVAAYGIGHYEEALREFEAAHAAEALPAFDYNIAKCLDNLGRRGDALVAYERYLTVAPAATNVDDVRALVARLRHEIAEQVPAVSLAPASRPSRRWIAPGVTGGLALAFAAVGGGLLGSALASYHDLSGACSPGCAPNSWANLPAREHAGEVLLGIAAAAAVVDVVLLVRAARRM